MKKKISKKTKVISLILSLVLVLGTVLSISIFNTFASEKFTDENGIEWTLTESYPGWAIKPSNETQMVGDIAIPSRHEDKLITVIVSNAFAGCSNLTSVTIPDSVAYIGSSAFNCCTNLTSVVIPDSVHHIDDNAFNMCSSLSSITIPDNIKTIGFNAFANCTSLTGELVIPDSVIEIEDNAFVFCSGLTSVTIPEGVTEIGDAVFSYCTNLTSVVIPDSVVSIGNSAFSDCSNLTTINIPNGVKTIGKEAFRNCKNLTSVTIPDSVTEIGNSAFYMCGNLKGELVIPDSVTYIGNSAFENSTKLTSVTIPEGNIRIGDYAFPSKFNVSTASSFTTFVDDNDKKWLVTPYKNGWAIKPHGLTVFADTIDIPNEYNDKPITKILKEAFAGYKKVTSITIPNSVTEIGYSAFRNCSGLTSITIPEGVTEIDDRAFEYCTGLTSVTIPDSVTYIGNGAFSSCTGLTSLNLGNSVEHIGDDAFGMCNFTNVTIPDSVTYIGDMAFSSCRNLTGQLIIPDNVIYVGDRAFLNSNFNSITFGNSVEYIGDSAFESCTNLTSVVIPDSVTYLSGFSNCSNLTTINIPNGVKTIGKEAFRNSYMINSITIPDSVTKIDDYAFFQAYPYDIITINENIEYVGTCAFGGLGELDTLTIETPETSNVHINAFYADTFKNLVVTDTVEKIDSVLLSGNKNFTNVSLGSNITNITNDAFYGNSNMTISTTKDATKVIKFASANNIPVNIVDNVDTTRTVDFEVTCDKTDYEFTVYRVADLEQSTMPYEVRYDSLITDIEDEIFEGDSEALLDALDAVDSSLLTEVVGTYSTNVDGASKLFEDLPAGIYYVRATNFPANVYSVQNSVFALPYYDAENDKWVYEIDPIPLATKVDESDPEIVKSITNSTQDNVNFTDVSLGDTVEFKIKSSRVGSANSVESLDFKLNSYVVSDIMESGLTLNQDSFVVTLEDVDGNTAATLDPATDYVVDITAEDGKDTTFTVSLTDTYLQEGEFYSDYSRYLAISYSAVLNEYSTREFDGNYNTATDLTWTNKTNVEATVEGNTVYAYTYGIEVNKYDDAGTPLAGSVFDLYLTKADAQSQTGSIATGTSDENGNVVFYTADGDVAKLQSGEYFIIETKATEGYNRYTDVIPVTISVEYGETEVNGTYIESAPENGVQLVEVKNSKVIIPNTGGNGAMYRYIIALAFLSLAITFVVLKKRENKKAKN